ncbi:MAG: hypothetical protein AB8B88_00265 [Devosiaceae bacterium]
MLSADQLSTIRMLFLGFTGLVCALYAGLAVLWSDPSPFSPWLPGLCGLGSAIIITLTARAAGDKSAEMAFDEGYMADSHKAQRYAYWIAVFLYPAFAVPLSLNWISWPVGFAAMGTLTGAAFLLLFVWFDLQGRREIEA